MLRLVKMERGYIPQLFEMMGEWTNSGEKIVPWSIAKSDYRDTGRYIATLDVQKPEGDLVPDSTFFLFGYGKGHFCRRSQHTAFFEWAPAARRRAYWQWHTAKRAR